MIAQQMFYLSGIYRALSDIRARLLPKAEALPEAEELGDTYLLDLSALLSYDVACRPKPKK